VVAIIFGSGSIAYRVRHEDDCDEYEFYELEGADEPPEPERSAGTDD
jgi:hypothetical protein